MRRAIGFIVLLAIILSGCENKDKTFPDFDYTSVYFPLQFPVRTLNLGVDRFDNSMDKELNFDIGVAIGGMYTNTQDWMVEFEIDASLCEGLMIEGEDLDTLNILPLPQSYYTLEPGNMVTIPSGSFSGLINVQLTEDFLSDPLAINNRYVIPLRILSSDADSILTGRPLVPDPDRRKLSDWDPAAPPKNFTLFMIKYINEYHGNYLRRGIDYTLDGSGNRTGQSVYHENYVEEDQVVQLRTAGRYELHTNFSGADTGGENGIKIEMDNSSGAITVDKIPGSSIEVPQGSGQFVEGGGSWGGKERNVIYLNYNYSRSGTNHEVFDTLVYRDNTIKFEVFAPIVME